MSCLTLSGLSGPLAHPRASTREMRYRTGNLAQAMRLAGLRRDIKAWRPSLGPRPTRDLTTSLGWRRIGLPGTPEDGLTLLEGMWNRDLQPGTAGGVWSSYFQTVEDARNGTVAFQLEPSRWTVMAYGTRESSMVCKPVWQAHSSRREVCAPNTDAGTLTPIDVARRLSPTTTCGYESEHLPRQMRAEEHTAQLTPGRPLSRRRTFKKDASMF